VTEPTTVDPELVITLLSRQLGEQARTIALLQAQVAALQGAHGGTARPLGDGQ
jgi:uncharacterized coiled-coil protein SlyX